MINRYFNRTIFKNNYEEYESYFRERDVKFINQYGTPHFSHVTKENIKNVTLNEHIWSVGDRFYKLAYDYYGNSEDWWVIAQFNNKPTESHIQIGEKIYIPTPISEAINILKG